jgi:plasmid stabilization system protein ParE
MTEESTAKAARRALERHDGLFTFTEVKRDPERERKVVEEIVKEAERSKPKHPEKDPD